MTLMLGWVLNGTSLRGACNSVAWMGAMDVDWGFDFPVPHVTTLRSWLLRLGHYHLTRAKEQADDWVWIMDHSNQLGQEKCLMILAVRVSELPPPGDEFPLRFSQMEPIELEVVVESNKEVVHQQLKANTAKAGVPRAIISDHGGDLAGGIELFRQEHPETLDIYDITHKAACLLKARLERDEQWGEFTAQVGRTKCRIQQTEWSFLVPPTPRLKGRYMNLGETIRWGKKTLAILDDPSPEVLRHGTRERLQEKLGWLGTYRESLQHWSEMEDTIDVVVNFVRTQGLYQEAGEDLGERLKELSLGPVAAPLSRDLADFVTAQGQRVRPGERLPGSSEILESCFGKYKTLERQQSKAGFTGLLLALAACVAERSQEVVHEALQNSKTRDVIAWIKNKLGDTFGSKRRKAYQAKKVATTAPSAPPTETKIEGSPMLAEP